MVPVMRWASDNPPAVGDIVVRHLGPNEDVPAGWTVAGSGMYRQCHRVYTGSELLDLARDRVITPPPLTDASTFA